MHCKRRNYRMFIMKLLGLVNRLKKRIETSPSRVQAYWICPLVEESRASDLMAAQKRFQELQKTFSDRVGLIHGQMKGPEKTCDVIIALTSASKSVYIGITGENVHITNIRINQTNRLAAENDIPRIAEKLNYINRIESDIPNVQISKPLALFTKGIEVKNNMKIFFHAQSLPEANLVWHCPYIILYYSEDGKVHGKNYREYAMIKFDGEENGSNENAENTFLMKKTEIFPGWEDWEELCKAGYECQVDFMKNGSEVMLRTQNKGIYIQNTTKVRDGNKEIFVAFSGDQVALTDIRIR